MGETLALRQSSGTDPVSNDSLKMIVSGTTISSDISTSILGEMSSTLGDLSALSFCRHLCTLSSVTSIVQSDGMESWIIPLGNTR